MTCKVCDCENNNGCGYCECTNYISIDEDGCCENILIKATLENNTKEKMKGEE